MSAITVSRVENQSLWASWIVSHDGLIHSQEGPLMPVLGLGPDSHLGVNYFEAFPESAESARLAIGGDIATVLSTFTTKTGTHTTHTIFVPHPGGAMGVCSLVEPVEEPDAPEDSLPHDLVDLGEVLGTYDDRWDAEAAQDGCASPTSEVRLSRF